MRAFLIAIIAVCALGVGLTYSVETVNEEVSLCYSETPDYYYQRRCEMEVYNDYFLGAVFLAVYRMAH